MPLITHSSYQNKPWYFLNPHFETIIPSSLYKIKNVTYQRERLTLEDGDFLDLDWCKNHHDQLMIVSHGLEGNAHRPYVLRCVKYFQKNWDILAWNYRGCSGEINRMAKTYHHGDIEDLNTLLEYVLTLPYKKVVLVGFSMGGNIHLKYLAQKNKKVNSKIKTAIGFSVPCNLEDSSREIEKKSNTIYLKRFLRKLKKKIIQKESIHPQLQFDWKKIKTFTDFNSVYTLPIYHFNTEQDFYDNARTDHLFDSIAIPTLIVNALNDPLLGGRNYPFESAENAKNVWLETPQYGGHVGFALQGKPYSWMEIRTESWLEDIN